MATCPAFHPIADYYDPHTMSTAIPVLDDAGNAIYDDDGQPRREIMTRVIPRSRVVCGRQAGHDGLHAGHGFRISGELLRWGTDG